MTAAPLFPHGKYFLHASSSDSGILEAVQQLGMELTSLFFTSPQISGSKMWSNAPPMKKQVTRLFLCVPAFYFRLVFFSVKHACVITLCRITIHVPELKLALTVPGSADCTLTQDPLCVCGRVCVCLWKNPVRSWRGCRVWLHVCCPCRATDTGTFFAFVLFFKIFISLLYVNKNTQSHLPVRF